MPYISNLKLTTFTSGIIPLYGGVPVKAVP